MNAKPWHADGTRCDSCERELVPGDLIAFAVDAPGFPQLSSNPPVCAECVTNPGYDAYGMSWLQTLRLMLDGGDSIEWVRVVAPPSQAERFQANCEGY